jgi:sugar phosphate isomerase/epimerase
MKRKQIAILLLAGSLSPLMLLARMPDTAKVGIFYAGCQAYTFRMFTVMEAIEKTAEAGGKTIQFYPRQKLSPEQGEVVFNHDSSDADIKQVKTKLAKEGIHAAAYGVVNFNANIDQSRKVFEFAKKMGIGILVVELKLDALDGIEALAKEYDMKIAIHNHPKKADNPDYKLWDPNYVLGLVKDRDPRLGACADTGHWMRSGLDPVESVRILKGRIHDCHLKDLNELNNPKARDVPYGSGVGNIAGALNALIEDGFRGPLHIEYESNWENNVPDVRQCIEYIKNFRSD